MSFEDPNMNNPQNYNSKEIIDAIFAHNKRVREANQRKVDPMIQRYIEVMGEEPRRGVLIVAEMAERIVGAKRTSADYAISVRRFYDALFKGFKISTRSTMGDIELLSETDGAVNEVHKASKRLRRATNPRRLVEYSQSCEDRNNRRLVEQMASRVAMVRELERSTRSRTKNN